MTMVISRGKKRAPGVRLRSLALAACLISPEAMAQSRDPQGCAPEPTSTLVVDVKDKGAKGDGKTDDTAAIQLAIKEIAGTGGTVLLPDGTYMVNAKGKNRLKVKSDITLKLSTGATLKAIPNDSKSYSVLSISGVSNVTVAGGTLEGDRKQHKGTSGEWGMGIRIDRGASHITISGVTSGAMWGDGFYIEDAKDVKFCSVTADNNRRQGLSIIDADGVLVTNSVFKNTSGTRPSAGIDLEPDKATQRITNVQIQGSKFFDNAGPGIGMSGKKGPISKIALTGNVFRGNRPILIKSAPEVLSTAICGNRQVTYHSESSGGLNAFADPAEVVALQSDCKDGRDIRFEVNKQRKPGKRSN
jgi:Pectate lyase superfamily protein